MSKSDDDVNGAIFLSDTNDQIKKKLMRAVTDSGREVTDNPSPGVKNLLTILAGLLDQSYEDMLSEQEGKSYAVLKALLVFAVIHNLAPIRDKAEKLMQDRAHLDKVLQDGRDRAREIAALTLDDVKKRWGLSDRLMPFSCYETNVPGSDYDPIFSYSIGSLHKIG